MSLITRCPACETMFKVVPDQLRISEGWVRCGQCDEIFDASFHLLQARPEAGPLATRAQQLPLTDDEAAAPAPPAPADIAPEAADTADLPEWREAAGEFTAPAMAPMEPEEEVAMLAPVAPVAPVTVDEALPAPLVQPRDAGTDRPGDWRQASFLRDPRPRPPRDWPRRRAFWLLLVLALSLGLLGQVVVQERDRLAASVPALQPWLQALCEPLNCTLAPLRRMDALVIDSSSFTRIRSEVYRLTFTLRNSAATALALPAVELTLTDALDQPVLRRVFLPVELGFPSDTLAPGSEWPASLAMNAKAGALGGRIAGYRLLVFYP